MLIKRQIAIAGYGHEVDVPDSCPICHRHSEMVFGTADVVENRQGVQAVFRCGYQGCRVFFICSYGPQPSSELLAVRPLKPPESMFPDTVSPGLCAHR
jgi:hypothetical protein